MRGIAIIGAIGLSLFLAPAPATAVSTCSFDEPNATVHVVIPGADTAVLSRSGDAIRLDGVACETATISNADLILIVDDELGPVGKPNVTIDLSGGPFAPGPTVETDGSSEIEIWHEISEEPAGTLRIVGSPGNDRFDMTNLSEGEVGAWFDMDVGSGLDGEGDLDITSFERFEFALGGGDDQVRIDELGGFAPPMKLVGGPGNDVLPDGTAGDEIHGGTGRDLLLAYIGDLRLDLTEPTFESGGELGQPISGIEDVRALSVSNIIEGTPGPNLLIGGATTDYIFGRGGNDVIRGGGGDDHVTGMGGNDVLAGASGPDELVGGSGADDLSGGDGPDRLWGGEGGDHLSGGRGNDVLRGGLGNDSCFGGAGTDTVSGCDP
jgi:Ca2+-binding RTX toxin-like protein